MSIVDDFAPLTCSILSSQNVEGHTVRAREGINLTIVQSQIDGFIRCLPWKIMIKLQCSGVQSGVSETVRLPERVHQAVDRLQEVLRLRLLGLKPGPGGEPAAAQPAQEEDDGQHG